MCVPESSYKSSNIITQSLRYIAKILLSSGLCNPELLLLSTLYISYGLRASRPNPGRVWTLWLGDASSSCVAPDLDIALPHLVWRGMGSTTEGLAVLTCSIHQLLQATPAEQTLAHHLSSLGVRFSCQT